MGRLRTVIRAAIEADTTPAALVATLNRFLIDHEDEMATCLCAILDQTTGSVRVANAGHPPLLRVRADGTTEYLGGATGLPLGVRPFATYREVGFDVAADETLVLFTDGLVERRGESIDDRLDLLANRASEAIEGGEGWCDRIVEAMIGARRDDDVALLGVRIERWRAPELEIEFPAELVHLRSVRDRVRSWLTAQPFAVDDIDGVLLSVGEATGNVAVHAYGAAGGQLRLRAVITGDDLEICVSDDGRWRPPRDEQGRGLRIIEQLNDSVSVESHADGTTITFRRRITAP
jgi:anti-sigma regulatory factor (Ser/Thr protein kinase)